MSMLERLSSPRNSRLASSTLSRSAVNSSTVRRSVVVRSSRQMSDEDVKGVQHRAELLGIYAIAVVAIALAVAVIKNQLSGH